MKPILLNDFLNGLNDKNILSQIFKTSVPATQIWTDINEINDLLYMLTVNSKSHCALLPEGGSIFLEYVEQSKTGCVDLIDTFRYRFNAKSLAFVSLDGNDNYYFLLESNASKPSGLNSNLQSKDITETVAEFHPGKYIDRKFYDNYNAQEGNSGSYQDLYPARPHLVRRYLKDSLVLIVNNDNPYRYTPLASSGFHDSMTPALLKDFMLGLFLQLERSTT